MFRRWITRINAGCRINGLSILHSFMDLRKGISLDRKILADLVVNDPSAFSSSKIYLTDYPCH